MLIGDTTLNVHATILTTFEGMLLGMSTLRQYNIDVLNSKKIVRVGKVEVPLILGRHDLVAGEPLPGIWGPRWGKFAGNQVAIFITLIMVTALAATDYFPREGRLQRRMHRGERLSKDDFLYILESMDRRENREWSNHVTDEKWKEARWEAYCRNIDVDVILAQRLGKKVFTGGLMRWKEDESETETAETTK
ncbi:hypothetical protein MMC28_004144 [Mycoblastus sanguinarius]|nr:hypothetical protein [Mycoblastus sanguinarius]